MKLYFKVTDEKIKQELLKGNEVSKKQKINVNFKELSEDERKLILCHCMLINEELYAGCFRKTKYEHYVERDTYIALNAVNLKEVLDCFKIFEKEKVKKEKTAIIRREKEIKDFIDGKTFSIERDGLYSDMSGNFSKEFDEKYKDYPGVIKAKDRLMSIKAEKEAEKQAEREARAKIKAEEKAEEKAKKEALKKWGSENGSELLKLRIKNNQNWFWLANEEYIRSIIPKGWILSDDIDEDENWEIKNGTLSQLRLLENTKKKFPNAHLMRFKFIEEDENWGDRNVSYRAFIVDEFESITGNKYDALLEIEDAADDNE